MKWNFRLLAPLFFETEFFDQRRGTDQIDSRLSGPALESLGVGPGIVIAHTLLMWKEVMYLSRCEDTVRKRFHARKIT